MISNTVSMTANSTKLKKYFVACVLFSVTIWFVLFPLLTGNFGYLNVIGKLVLLNDNDYYNNNNNQNIDDQLTIVQSSEFENEYSKLACKFARLNPWDKSIIDMVYHPRTIECNETQPYFTFLDGYGNLHMNQTAVVEYEAQFGGGPIQCLYYPFDRSPDSDEDSVFGYGPSGVLNLTSKGVKLEMDMVEVICKNSSGTEIYYDLHAHPVPRKNQTFRQPTDDQLSVLMLMMDSTSISVLKRHLPKTYGYIKDVMKFKIFNGFHKIGDNSFPNMVAALTGYRYQYEQRDMPPDIQDDVSQIQFDHWPLIWKDFARRGYATVFNEDKAEWGLFRYYVKGFRRKPVDYYYHMYWYAVYRREWQTNVQVPYCFQNKPKIERLLDLVRRHVISMQTTLQFQYAFLTDLCHENDGSEIERADEYMVQFFRDMHENGYLNKTVVLFYSDHGHRYTPIRSTLVGLLEERTPMFNVWFPPWFYERYPHIEKNLQLNTVRLSSLYDVHETLHDLAEANFNGFQRDVLKSRGLSQLYPIPVERTCFEAGVPDHHCTCLSMTPIAVNSTEAQMSAFALLVHINRILLEYSSLCYQFKLAKVLRVEQLQINKKLAYGVARYSHVIENSTVASSTTRERPAAKELYPMASYRVAIELLPMNAQFEAVVERIEESDEYKVNGDVSRLNKFGNQSYCAPKKILQKFCVCRLATSVV